VIRAVLFDVDGTLYRQSPLRAFMLLEILAYGAFRPASGWKVAGTLSVFRRERERLRGKGGGTEPLERLQYEVVATRLRTTPEYVKAVVEEWMFRRPLRYLRFCKRPGIEPLFEACADLGVRVGAFSDYPTKRKLEALGVSPWFDLHLAGTDPEINAFKPSPRGILHACALWEIDPRTCLYVGDRPEVDGVAARNAKARFALATRGFNRIQNWVEMEGER